MRQSEDRIAFHRPLNPGRSSLMARRKHANPIPLSERSCEDLAHLACDGSASAYAELVHRYEERLFNFLLRRTRDRVDAEDLTQETFLRAWQRLERYDAHWRFSTWLFTIGARLAVNHHRARRPEIASDSLDYSTASTHDPAHAASVRELAGNLWTLASRLLSRDQLTALWLRYAESMSLREIGLILGKSEVATRVMLFRARDLLTRHVNMEDEQIIMPDQPEADMNFVGEHS